MPLFQIRPVNQSYAILEDGRAIHTLPTIREAKAYRDAIDWAINEHGMAHLVALTYADQRSQQELRDCLETEAPNEHFTP